MARSSFLTRSKLVLLAATTTFTVGAAIAEDLRFGDDAARTADERRRAIKREIRGAKGNGWAGSYYGGDGLGVNQGLELAPQTGFVFEWHGCLGLYDRNYGAVVAEGDHLRLVPEHPNSDEGFQGIAEELVWVRWGARSYLVPAKEMQTFCNEVNSGSEPRDGAHGWALLRNDDWKKPAVGKPQLPPVFARCLLEAPLEPRVVAIVGVTVRTDSIGTRWIVTDATIDRGARHGVALGMRLDSPDGESFLLARVVAVDPETATIRVEELEERDGVDELKPGMRLTTRPFDREEKTRVPRKR